jgi:hypothetical protein
MLPDLFYSPGDFYEPDRRRWGILSHKQRYIELNARRLSSDKSGLAIYVSYHNAQVKYPALNVDTACNMTMYFDPWPHVGFTAEMVGGKARFQMLAYEDPEDKMECRKALKFRQAGIDGLVHRIRELYARSANEREENWVEASIGIIKEPEGVILEKAGVAQEGEVDDLGVGEQNFVNGVSENV